MVAQILSYPAFSILLSYKLTARVFGELARLSLGYHTVPAPVPVTIPNPIISTPTSPLHLNPTPTSLAQPCASVFDYVGLLAWPVAILILALGTFLSSKALAWTWKSVLISDLKLRVRRGFTLALEGLLSIMTWASLRGSSLPFDVKLGLCHAQSFANHMNNLHWDQDCAIPVALPVLIMTVIVLLDWFVESWLQIPPALLKMYPFLRYLKFFKDVFKYLGLAMLAIIIAALLLFEMMRPRPRQNIFSWLRWTQVLTLDIRHRSRQATLLRGQLNQAQVALVDVNGRLSMLRGRIDELDELNDVLETYLLPPSYVQVSQEVAPSYAQALAEGAFDEWSASIVSGL
ncbi:hypothetical protein FPV67DRAFT_1783268 [Lyophyllum atratum]|nr:hypothetical protein FPV67DRAFT_1783268 [Lyophyllum atratum]